ncbi:hypothetical protein OBA40_05020 [Alphaproteobacteria bacterium]|nr:hypothetical protein [Alphaproteobacteria bacterium]
MVGGAIRDYLINKEIHDIDFVINMNINVFLENIKKKNIKINSANIDYKTISIILNNREYQITSFRKDLVSFGRSAFVDFTHTLYEDAKRRDFTINALYLDEKGNLIDPFGGYKDIIDKKLRFIGDPISRIEEDHLRILRFCRFYGTFPIIDIDKNLKAKIIKKANKISILSNMRIRNELYKILMATNFELCLSMLVKLELDKHILKKINKNDKINKHAGFNTKDFEIVNYIRIYGLNIINSEKLDLISTVMPHLYNLENFDMIIKRFELNKRKIKYLKFIKQLKNDKLKINQNIMKQFTSREIKLYTLKFIWKYRCKINKVNKDFFMKDRIPFNWYKFGLLHVFPIEIIKQIDLFNLEWPILTLTRKKIQSLQDKTYVKNIDDLIFKAEDFWVNNNFNSSPENILIFLESYLDKEIRYDN